MFLNIHQSDLSSINFIRVSTYPTMFSTVVGTFLRFLAWYAIIIVAFGIAFYIMFHQVDTNS